jgi:hypothetical protein
MNFKDALEAALNSRGITPKSFFDPTNIAETTILNEYGAVYLADFFVTTQAATANAVISTAPFPFSPLIGAAAAAGILVTRVKIPPKCIFANSAEVDAFQNSVIIAKEKIGGKTIELQAKAMWALQQAETDAKDAGLKITPRPDATGARRSYADTVTFWNNKITSGIAHWTKKANKAGKKLSQTEADKLNALSGKAQIEKVLELEAQGFFFSTHHNKTILRSVAAPGTSQHLLMLALDIEEFKNKKTREIMAKNGWFQTVFQDHPHFTYLGLGESNLSSLGLTKKTDAGQDFWVPKP